MDPHKQWFSLVGLDEHSKLTVASAKVQQFAHFVEVFLVRLIKAGL
jgi:hypothetical protein